MLFYPANGSGGSSDSFYVLTQADANLANGKLLIPGPGIMITVSGGTVAVQTTTPGGTTQTYFTENDETATLPNSLQLKAGSNVTFTPGANSVTISASASGSASTQSFLTVNAEGTLVADRQFTVTSPLKTVDGGAGGLYTVSINPGISTQVLTASSGAVQFQFGGDIGVKLSAGGGTITLATTAESFNSINCTSGSYTFNVPLAATCSGKKLTFTKTDSSANTITIQRQGGDLISGSSSFVIYSQYASRSLYSDGTQWLQI